MSIKIFNTTAEWREAALALMLGSEREWKACEVIAHIGTPPTSTRAQAQLAYMVEQGTLASEGLFGARTFTATGRAAPENMRNGSRFGLVGRNAPRVCSVWDYAERRAA